MGNNSSKCCAESSISSSNPSEAEVIALLPIEVPQPPAVDQELVAVPNPNGRPEDVEAVAAAAGWMIAGGLQCNLDAAHVDVRHLHAAVADAEFDRLRAGGLQADLEAALDEVRRLEAAVASAEFDRLTVGLLRCDLEIERNEKQVLSLELARFERIWESSRTISALTSGTMTMMMSATSRTPTMVKVTPRLGLAA